MHGDTSPSKNKAAASIGNRFSTLSYIKLGEVRDEFGDQKRVSQIDRRVTISMLYVFSGSKLVKLSPSKCFPLGRQQPTLPL